SSTPCVPGTPAPARGRRPYNQALKARLARCEELLNNSNDRRNDFARENGTPQSAHFHTPTKLSHVSKWTTDGKLVENNPNGKVTFMDNYRIGMVNDEPFVVEATNGPRGLSSNIISLMLSIFLMAVISMTEDECDRSLGISTESAIVTFSEATQQALRRLDFMRTDDSVVLQTLCLYMVCSVLHLDFVR
ncbi:fungal specific transcription factor domain-containing protein, partial [Colletotrichum asianum]